MLKDASLEFAPYRGCMEGQVQKHRQFHLELLPTCMLPLVEDLDAHRVPGEVSFSQKLKNGLTAVAAEERLVSV